MDDNLEDECSSESELNQQNEQEIEMVHYNYLEDQEVSSDVEQMVCKVEPGFVTCDDSNEHTDFFESMNSDEDTFSTVLIKGEPLESEYGSQNPITNDELEESECEKVIKIEPLNCNFDQSSWLNTAEDDCEQNDPLNVDITSSPNGKISKLNLRYNPKKTKKKTTRFNNNIRTYGRNKKILNSGTEDSSSGSNTTTINNDSNDVSDISRSTFGNLQAYCIKVENPTNDDDNEQNAAVGNIEIPVVLLDGQHLSTVALIPNSESITNNLQQNVFEDNQMETVEILNYTPDKSSGSQSDAGSDGEKNSAKNWTKINMQSALKALANRTMSLSKASSAYGIPSTTLWQRAHKLGIHTPKREESCKKWNKQILNSVLEELRAGSISANKASKAYGIPSSTLYKIARKNGIKLMAPFNAAPTSWSREDLNRALEAIRSGQITVQQAAAEYGIPSGTLYGRCRREKIELTGQLCSWSEDVMSEALEAARLGRMSINQVAIHYNVPYSSLYGRIKKSKPDNDLDSNAESSSNAAAQISTRSVESLNLRKYINDLLEADND